MFNNLAKRHGVPAPTFFGGCVAGDRLYFFMDVLDGELRDFYSPAVLNRICIGDKIKAMINEGKLDDYQYTYDNKLVFAELSKVSMRKQEHVAVVEDKVEETIDFMKFGEEASKEFASQLHLDKCGHTPFMSGTQGAGFVMRTLGHSLLVKLHRIGLIHFDSHAGNIGYRAENAATTRKVVISPCLLDFGRCLYITRQNFEEWVTDNDPDYQRFSKKFTYSDDKGSHSIGYKELLMLDHYFLAK